MMEISKIQVLRCFVALQVGLAPIAIAWAGNVSKDQLKKSTEFFLERQQGEEKRASQIDTSGRVDSIYEDLRNQSCLFFLHGTNENYVGPFGTLRKVVRIKKEVGSELLPSYSEIYQLARDEAGFNITCGGKLSEKDYFNWQEFADATPAARYRCALEFGRFVRRKGLDGEMVVVSHSHGGNCAQLATQNIYSVNYKKQMREVVSSGGRQQLSRREVRVAPSFAIQSLDNGSDYLSESTLVNFYSGFLLYMERGEEKPSKDRLDVLGERLHPEVRSVIRKALLAEGDLTRLDSKAFVSRLLSDVCDRIGDQPDTPQRVCRLLESRTLEKDEFLAKQLHALEVYTESFKTGLKLDHEGIVLKHLVTVNTPPILGSYRKKSKYGDTARLSESKRVSHYFYQNYHTIGNPYEPNWDKIDGSFRYVMSTNDGVVFGSLKTESSKVFHALGASLGKEMGTELRVLKIGTALSPNEVKKARERIYDKQLSYDYIKLPNFLLEGYAAQKVKRSIVHYGDPELLKEESQKSLLNKFLTRIAGGIFKTIEEHSRFYSSKEDIVELFEIMVSQDQLDHSYATGESTSEAPPQVEIVGDLPILPVLD